jgi:quercetin dioxygenase-like cupin family protein
MRAGLTLGCMTTTETLITAYASPTGTGERIWIVGDTLTFKATAETTGGTLTAIECEAAPGGGPPPHIHENEDESFYVLDGRFEILLGDKLLRAGPGDYAFVPRGTVHRFANVGDGVGRILILFTPGGLERFFRMAGTPATNDAPAPPVDAAEIVRTDAAAARHGLRITR